MSAALALSTCIVQTGIRRGCPRPPELRNATYDSEYDWSTLFYDVYRVGPHIVFQGPPLYGFIDELKRVEPFAHGFRRWLHRARYFGERKRGEIWLRSDAGRVEIDCALGRFDVPVQPNLSARFAGARVLLTISKDNELRWIVDWLRFHQRIQGATAAIIYDNNSTIYTCAQLQAELAAAVPGMDVLVIAWPFPYGPQGGAAGAVNGVEAPWDSDFCQIGILQHARFRLLLKARSVMHVDIDELVLGKGKRSVFEAAEQARSGMVKFEGRWISVASQRPLDRRLCRHADFILDEGPDAQMSPPKWCIRPQAFARHQSWSVHNIFEARANRAISGEFLFRHLRGITTSWKYDRWAEAAPDPASLPRDDELIAAYARAGLQPSPMQPAEAGRALEGRPAP